MTIYSTQWLHVTLASTYTGREDSLKVKFRIMIRSQMSQYVQPCFTMIDEVRRY